MKTTEYAAGKLDSWDKQLILACKHHFDEYTGKGKFEAAFEIWCKRCGLELSPNYYGPLLSHLIEIYEKYCQRGNSLTALIDNAHPLNTWRVGYQQNQGPNPNFSNEEYNYYKAVTCAVMSIIGLTEMKYFPYELEWKADLSLVTKKEEA